MSKNNEQDLRVSMGDPRGFQGNGTKASLPLKKKKLKTYLAWLGLSRGTRVFNCSMWDLVPPTRDRTRAPALGAWSLSHWTTSEVSSLPVWLWSLESSQPNLPPPPSPPATTQGLLSSTTGKESACQCRKHKRRWFDHRVGKIPWRRVW